MIKTSDELLNLDISYCKSKYDKSTQTIKLFQSLNDIKSDRSKKIIESMRSDLQNKNKYKDQLDGFIFTGTFSARGTKNIISYSNLCVLDFDKLSNEDLIILREYLLKDKFVFAFWNSPSGTGIKGLIYFDFTLSSNYKEDLAAYHKKAFYQFSNYFDKTYNNPNIKLDNSGNDLPRICFTSYDPNIVIKNQIECFLVDISEVEQIKVNKTNVSQKIKRSNTSRKIISEDMVKNITRETNQLARRKIQSVYKYLYKRNLSITETYERWYKVAQIIANTFSYNIGKEYFLKICRLDIITNKHDEEKSKELIIRCYLNSLVTVENPLHFDSLLFYAKEKGWNMGKGEIK